MGTNLNQPMAEQRLGKSPAAAPPVIPEHELLRLIGAGGSGEVWLARNTVGTFRAVKIVRANTPGHERAFQRELSGVLKFEPVSRLHDGLVDILQVGGGEAVGYFYCVMELADDVSTGQTIVPERYQARTLAYDLTQRRRLPIGECVRLGAAIASALGFLHRQGLLHRDIKPSNIIFVNGFPKLADVGLVSEISAPRAHIGTEGFIAPEGTGTAQADVYSLGKVLYEISSGKDRHDYPELPADLGETAEDRDLVMFTRLVINACRTNPRHRCQSAEELLSALLAFQFSTCAVRQAKTTRFLVKLAAVGGVLVAATVFTLLVWRMVWLLRHGQ
jgi:eukaryotic-like serine/threonine-protein kinase